LTVREVEKNLSEEPDAEGAEESEKTTSSIGSTDSPRQHIEQLEQRLTITDGARKKLLNRAASI
jgi:hypothetical protein